MVCAILRRLWQPQWLLVLARVGALIRVVDA